jgi:DNA-binding transcriptional MerR regulator
MSEIGEGIAKPWDRETCRRRYVEGAAIGLRPLAELSGVNICNIRNWSRKDLLDPQNRTWPKQREQYINEVRSKSREKSVEAITDQYAAQNTRALEQHIELSEKMRKLADIYLNAASTKINRFTNPDKVSAETEAKADKIINFFKEIGGRTSLQVCANILGQAISIERQARYLDLVDPAILEKAAARHGLSLVDLEAE